MLAVGGLLVAEYLVVSFLFDVRVLAAQHGALAWLAYLGDAATMVLLAGAGVLIVQGSALNQRLAVAMQAQPDRRAFWPLLLLHALAYGAFVLLGARVLAEGALPSVVATWVAPWLLSGVLLVLALVPVVLPMSAIKALLGTGVRALFVAGAMGLLIWMLAKGGELLWPQLSGPTIRVAGWLLARVSDQEVVMQLEDHVLGTPLFVVQIAPICSGLEGMGLMFAFLGAFMFVHRDSLRFPRALWLLPVAVAVSWCANIVRIVALVLVGAWVSPQIAIGGFHSKAGWFLFCLLAFGFVVLLRRSRWFSIDADTATEAAASSDLAPFIAPLLGLLATMLSTGLWTAGFDTLYGLRIGVAGALLVYYRSHYRGLWVRPGWQALALGVAVFAIWIALVPRHDPEASRPLQDGLADLDSMLAAVWIAVRVVGSVVVVPIVEELAFRGFLLRRLVARNFTEVPYGQFTFVSFTASSLAFGLMHSAPLAGTLAGMAYAAAQYRRGRLSDAIAAHVVTNGLIAADVLVNGAWALW